MKRTTWLLALLMLLTAFILTGCVENLPGETTNKPSSTSTTPISEHKDADNNGICDSCQISVIVDIDLFAINDLHGMFMDSDVQPGVDELTTYLKNANQKNGNTIIFSSGDMWQGSAESGLTKGNIITDWMNELDFAFMTMGNHEFDWGHEVIRENKDLAEFPFLAINIFDKETNKRVDYCDGSVLVDLGELQVGFIGAIGDCYSSISGEYSADFYFKTGDELTALVKAESEKLRSQGADLIVYSLHDNSDGCSKELTDGYVDIVFEGHSHSEYVTKDRNGVYHIQAASYNSAIAYAPVSYNTVTGTYSVDPELVYSDVYDDCTSDSIVNDLLEKYDDQTSLVTSDVGRNDVYRDSMELRELVAKLYADLAAEKWSNYNVVLGGGYLSCRSPSCLEAGNVSYNDLYTLFPFDNKLALCSISGENLLRYYINSINPNYFLSYTQYGESIRDSIDPEETYYIVVDAYNYTYIPEDLGTYVIDEVVDSYDNTTFARDLVARYIRNGGMEEELEPLQADCWYDIGMLLDYIARLPENTATEEMYYTAGVILEISNTTYGQMVIEDYAGRITLYNLYDHETGARYDAMENPPQVGDVILVYGTLKNYVSQGGEQILEFATANLVRLPMGNDPTVLTTIPQLMALTLSVGPHNTTEDKYCFKAKIKEIVSDKYGNAWLVDEDGNEFYIYGMYDQDGKRYDEMENPPQEGDTVTLYGVLKYYVDSNGNVLLEMVNAELQ